jgi:hypothetical protein
VGHKARLIANMPRARQNNLDLNNHCKLDSLVFVQLFMILMKNKEDQTKQNITVKDLIISNRNKILLGCNNILLTFTINNIH